jgi:hypothetical protein
MLTEATSAAAACRKDRVVDFVDDDTYTFLLEAYITHCQLLQANGSKEPNLKI